MKKKILNAVFIVGAAFALAVFGGMAVAPKAMANDYNTLVHFLQGGDTLVVESGGLIDILSGGTLTMESGSIFTAPSATFSGNVTASSYIPVPKTSAQLAVSTPSATGQQTFNSTINAWCQGRSTTTAGSWYLVSSTATACQ